MHKSEIPSAKSFPSTSSAIIACTLPQMLVSPFIYFSICWIFQHERWFLSFDYSCYAWWTKQLDTNKNTLELKEIQAEKTCLYMNGFCGWHHEALLSYLDPHSYGQGNSSHTKNAQHTLGWVRHAGQVTAESPVTSSAGAVSYHTYDETPDPAFPHLSCFIYFLMTDCHMVKDLQGIQMLCWNIFFSLLSLPPSVSFFRCAIISLPLQTNLSLSTLQTGDACALMMLI